LEVAIAAKAIALVTGNQIHYPLSARQSIDVLSPSQFVEFFRKQPQT
jgi:predicted nucleic acid-binding protein